MNGHGTIPGMMSTTIASLGTHGVNKNTTWHSAEWRINAQNEKLLIKGFTLEYCFSEKSYNGVGGNATKASTMFRVGFAIEVGTATLKDMELRLSCAEPNRMGCSASILEHWKQQCDVVVVSYHAT